MDDLVTWLLGWSDMVPPWTTISSSSDLSLEEFPMVCPAKVGVHDRIGDLHWNFRYHSFTIHFSQCCSWLSDERFFAVVIPAFAQTRAHRVKEGDHPADILYIPIAVSGHQLFSPAFFQGDSVVPTHYSATLLAWWWHDELNVKVILPSSH